MEPPISATLRDQTLDLLASGTATSRADLIEALQVAPSTVTTVVRRLLEEGVILEEGVGRSTGGRRPRILRLRETKGVLAVAEFGGKHARVGLCAPGGGLRTTEEVAIDIAAGPEEVLDVVAATFARLQAAAAPGQPLLGVGVALPGPVEFPRGRVIGPARMPGWSGVDAKAHLAERFQVPVAVENDAKAAAIGEYVTRDQESGDMIYVKAGTGIGACLVSDGQIYRGGRGLSGDVTHVRVEDSGEQSCSCGSSGCLETVASGAALARQLVERGSSATTVREIMAAVSDADPAVVTMVRHAGRLLGVALSGLVNFLNPDAVVIGGALSSLDVYVAATRGMLYERCLPSMTQSLTIEASVAGPDAALVGLGHLLRTTADVRLS
ncbi:ROK family transcriptional regulator [Micromonospora soli]|uniref:ROK family transcriptional regulator n=1 Tax=Micromonospora sp. NBRC 110009 TaxID=3061627 RepID=UPI0026729E22|nr:ROK family transcriptional regulator [Micromonospora sp. NBRC 110009]WKT97004.1 ROK family transcriptional regulator [Micromonospora sp. NBRC 110009]